MRKRSSKRLKHGAGEPRLGCGADSGGGRSPGETRSRIGELHGQCTAVRITHLPTGITVACQSERSHLKNREFAMRMLLGRLAVFQRSDAAERMSARQGEQRAIEWDNPIRSYVFQPCTLVQDHRTNAETRDIIAVMEGEIDPLIHAYLTQIRGNGR